MHSFRISVLLTAVALVVMLSAETAEARACPRIYLPVCARTASGRQTFGNPCMLLAYREEHRTGSWEDPGMSEQAAEDDLSPWPRESVPDLQSSVLSTYKSLAADAASARAGGAAVTVRQAEEQVGTSVLAATAAVTVFALVSLLLCRALWRRRGGGGGGGCALGYLIRGARRTPATGAGRVVERGDIEAGPYAWHKDDPVYFVPLPEYGATRGAAPAPASAPAKGSQPDKTSNRAEPGGQTRANPSPSGKTDENVSPVKCSTMKETNVVYKKPIQQEIQGTRLESIDPEILDSIDFNKLFSTLLPNSYHENEYSYNSGKRESRGGDMLDELSKIKINIFKIPDHLKKKKEQDPGLMMAKENESPSSVTHISVQENNLEDEKESGMRTLKDILLLSFFREADKMIRDHLFDSDENADTSTLKLFSALNLDITDKNILNNGKSDSRKNKRGQEIQTDSSSNEGYLEDKFENKRVIDIQGEKIKEYISSCKETGIQSTRRSLKGESDPKACRLSVETKGHCVSKSRNKTTFPLSSKEYLEYLKTDLNDTERSKLHNRFLKSAENRKTTPWGDGNSKDETSSNHSFGDYVGTNSSIKSAYENSVLKNSFASLTPKREIKTTIENETTRSGGDNLHSKKGSNDSSIQDDKGVFMKNVPDYVFVKNSNTHGVQYSETSHGMLLSNKEGPKRNVCKRCHKDHSLDVCITAKKILLNKSKDENSIEVYDLFISLVKTKMKNIESKEMMQQARSTTTIPKNWRICIPDKKDKWSLLPYIHDELRLTIIMIRPVCKPKRLVDNYIGRENNLSMAQNNNAETKPQRREWEEKLHKNEIPESIVKSICATLDKGKSRRDIEAFVKELDPLHVQLFFLGLDGMHMTLRMYQRLFFCHVGAEDVMTFSAQMDDLERRIAKLADQDAFDEGRDAKGKGRDRKKEKLTEEEVLFVMVIYGAFVLHDKACFDMIIGCTLGCVEHFFIYSVSLYEKEGSARSSREAKLRAAARARAEAKVRAEAAERAAAKAAAQREAGEARAARRRAVRGSRKNVPSARAQSRRDDSVPSHYAYGNAATPAAPTLAHAHVQPLVHAPERQLQQRASRDRHRRRGNR